MSTTRPPAQKAPALYDRFSLHARRTYTPPPALVSD